MECRKIQEMLTPYLEEALSPEQRLLVREHLSACGECKAAMEDLKKTIALVKDLEEVEPPAWLTQKVMACVREEAEKKGGILKRFFYPLHIKVPLEVFATFLVVGLVAYVYKTTTPQFEEARVPGKAQVLSQGEPPPRTPEDVSTAARRMRGKATDAGRTRKQEAIQGADKEASPQELSDRLSAERETPAGAERSLQETEKAGVLRGQADSAQEAGAPPQSAAPAAPAFAPESRPASPQRQLAVGRSMAAPPEPAPPKSAGKNGPGRLDLTVRVADVDAAAQQVEKLLVDAGARHVTRSPHDGAESLSAELKGDKVKGFVQKLNAIGDTGGPEPGVPGGETVAVRVGVVGEGKADRK